MIDWTTITLEELAGLVSDGLRKHGIDTIPVGGACVTIYSKNRYQSYNLDYITYADMKKVKQVLFEMGFKENNKYFQHEGCQWFLEFVSPPVAVGNEPIYEFNLVDTPLGKIKLLKPIDSVKDRLANFYHWNDKQCLEQAVNICLEQNIDFNELEKWSFNENQIEKFRIFITKIEQIIN